MIKEKYISNVKETSINIINSNLDSLKCTNDTKTTFRVYKDGYIGIKGAIGKCNENRLEKEALEALNDKIKYPFNPTINRQEAINKSSKFINEDKIVTETDDFLYRLKTEHPNFIFSNRLGLKETSAKLLNDKGLNLEYNDKSLDVKLLFKHKTSQNSFDGYIMLKERKYDKSLLLKEINLIINAFKTKVDLLKPGKYPVIFTSSMLPVKKLISDLNGDLYISQNSLLANKIGQKLFNENFTFYESHNPEDVLNTPFFDGDGIVNDEYRYPLIENGILKAVYTDKKTSQKYKLPLTGSAIPVYNSLSKLGFINYKISDSKNTLKELLSGDIGIMVMNTHSGGFNADGSYAAPVQLSFLFDGERLLGSLPNLQLSSNIYEMFGRDFRGISQDTFMPFSTNKFGVIDLNVSKL